MKRKVAKYLSSKDKSTYTQLDFLFEIYLKKGIEKELTNLNFYDIEIFAYCNKRFDYSLQLNFKYFNIVCTVDFFNERYEYIIYAIGDSLNQLDEYFTENQYEKDFCVNDLFQKVYVKLKDHPRLKDNTQLLIKQKKYNMISNICLILPVFIIGVISVYVLITKDTLTVSPLFILVIVLPIIFWLIFSVKAARIK